MKKIALAAALSVAATTAFAGGMAEPVMEPTVVEAGTSSSGGGGTGGRAARRVGLMRLFY